MKTLKTLAILFSTVLLLNSKCIKNNKTYYNIKGRLMIDCNTPYANSVLKFRASSGNWYEDKEGNTDFYTDADGYFDVNFNPRGSWSSLYTSKEIMSHIPSGTHPNLNIGEVMMNGTVNFVIKLQVNNPHTANDTLILRDWNGGSAYAQLRIPGPFQSGIVDTVWNQPYISYPIEYKEIPKFQINFSIRRYISGSG